MPPTSFQSKGIKQLTGKAVITSTPISMNSWMANYAISMSSWFNNYYQQNQTQKNLNFDTIGKLVIQNYSKDLGSGVFWGWDLVEADELSHIYAFKLRNRENNWLNISVTIGRELQTSDLENNLYQMYQCYIDDNINWNERIWLDANNLSHKNFWGKIERLVDKHHPLYPF